MRRIGVELEFTGIDIPKIAQLVADTVQGTIRALSPYRYEVVGSPEGTYSIEVDSTFVTKKTDRLRASTSSPEMMDQLTKELIQAAVEHVIPSEVATPPLPMDRLSHVNTLIERLREAGAQGTGEGVLYAFAMQLNPELPSLDAPTVRAYLKAFLCLFEWLKKHSRVDLTRRVTRFATPFPREYVRKVVDPHYQPPIPQLIDDYLDYNPKRDRALDMLPLFTYLDQDRVRAAVRDQLVKPRPTLHYRLPNCEISKTHWGLDEAWNDWLQVERLASDAPWLMQVCQRYVAHLDDLFRGLLGNWAEDTEQWLRAHTDR